MNVPAWLERPAVRPALAASSGILLALSFPKFGHGLVAWFALTPLFISLHGLRPGRAFRLGWWSGFVAQLGLLYWTAFVVSQFGGLPRWIAAALVPLLAGALAVATGLVGWLLARALRRHGVLGWVMAPSAWVATELIRDRTYWQFPWCLLGYSQHDFPVVVQVAALGGVYAVSFVVAGVAAAMACACTADSPRIRARALTALASLLLVDLGYGWLRLAQPAPANGSLRVGIVQASIPQEEKWRADRASANVDRHVALTREAARQGAELVAWPESAVPHAFDLDPETARPLQALVRSLGVHLLFGNDDWELSPGHERVFVGAKLLSPDGNVVYRHHKMRLVPFGEYVPMSFLITMGGRFTGRLVQRVGEFTPGSELRTGAAGRARVGSLICYEAIFPELSAELTRQGAQILFALTNDGWYGWSSAPYQHFSMARLRAIESGRYVVRVANTGISGIVDPRGRIVVRTALFAPALVVHDVPLAAGTTPYVRIGDAFAWSCLVLAALGAVRAARRSA